MTEEYSKANQELYDETAKQFREACRNAEFKDYKIWRKELKERMRLLDQRLKGLEEE